MDNEFTSPFNQEVLRLTIGVINDEENDEFLLIGPEGQLIALESDGEDIHWVWQEYGQG